MITVRLICVGKLRERFYTDAVNEYVKRLKSYCKLEIVELPEFRLPDDPSQAQISGALEKERADITSKIPAGTYVIALCKEGREMDSAELAGFFETRASLGTSRFCFIIGGSYGLHDLIKEQAKHMLSMSKMTFPHTLARVILLEQLYRAFNISEGGKYHK